MPGYDGKGPEGKGPMTGRGQGYCSLPGEQVPAGSQQSNPGTLYGLGRGGLPRGGGRGFGRGRGRFRRGFAYIPVQDLADKLDGLIGKLEQFFEER